MSLFACGLSAATNSTPLSISSEMNARLRDSRSSLAMTSLAFSFCRPRALRRAVGDRRACRLHLGEFAGQRPATAVQIVQDGLLLRFPDLSRIALGDPC